MTQQDFAVGMVYSGHRRRRSTVSALEGNGRKVTVDELFGLALSLGGTIGQLLDPTGPDHSRKLALDVGRNVPGGAEPGAHLDAIEPGKHEARHDQVEWALRLEREPVVTPGGDAEGEAVEVDFSARQPRPGPDRRLEEILGERGRHHQQVG
jgi:hypothetical protein